MAELQVLVEQQVGVINWNFEQLKAALAEKMQEYEGLVYTAENVKVAKTDIAELRKLKKAISDKRIEIKNKCLEPYEIIEKQAGELTELIDKPIIQIDRQLAEYEKNRREEIRGKILEYFDEIGAGKLPDNIFKAVKAQKYNESWENVTMATKRWKQGVEDAVRSAERDLLWIEETVEEEYRESAVAAYERKLDLKDVMDEVTRLRKQRELILAKERERIAAEERAKAEAELKARQAAEPGPEIKAAPEPVEEARETPENAPKPPERNKPSETSLIAEKEHSRTREGDMSEIHTIRIKATAEQYAKIKGYINYCGAVFREVEA